MERLRATKLLSCCTHLNRRIPANCATRFVTISLLGLSGVLATWGQSGSSSILGTLTDQTGAVIAGADVTITEVNTGTVHHATSSDGGLFRVLDLLPGKYSAAIKAAGFKSVDIQNVNLASSETRSPRLGVATRR